MIISILLDGNGENVFYSGQNVTGHVRVETTEQIKMRGIRVEVYGNARVHWSEGSGKNRRSYSGNENFIELKTYITGSENSNSELFLQPGVHTIPMSFLLTDTLPSSFEGIHGSIRYRVKAVVDRPWRVDDSTEIAITVIRLLNLNYEPPQLKEPVVMQCETPSVGCCYYCCCVKGLPEMELTINRGCFVPGETIIVNGQVTNKSNTKIKRIVIAFMQETQFCATNASGRIYRTNFQYKTLASIDRPTIDSGRSDSWNNIAFPIPPLMASRLDGSNIIHLSYYIQVRADFARGCADSKIRQDVIIGHIPLQDGFHSSGAITTQPPMYPMPFQQGTVPFQHGTNFSLPQHPSYNDQDIAGWKQDNSSASVAHK